MINEKPAFPCVISEDMKEVSYGMDLHDWFAGQALNAVYKQCVADGGSAFPIAITEGWNGGDHD